MAIAQRVNSLLIIVSIAIRLLRCRGGHRAIDGLEFVHRTPLSATVHRVAKIAGGYFTPRHRDIASRYFHPAYRSPLILPPLRFVVTILSSGRDSLLRIISRRQLPTHVLARHDSALCI
ncbi:hypothetical protein BOTBODRAFT_299761 [Botryobasidium botryosum FD-172 SS1]|uniref:Secreted protein n=1 Tax=Botryobasidium botryosum (strain FD-172 SS1) TaxID=930990 RepID=A0A067M2A0_BOTB1|nr:hypothetical protein BOTBODRAFT_299761 [Botryobasidium botryosum FD-172 SS1]